MVRLNHPLSPSIPSLLPEACVPATAGKHAELLVYILPLVSVGLSVSPDTHATLRGFSSYSNYI